MFYSRVSRYTYWDGWMDGWMVGWMDGWMDGWLNTHWRNLHPLRGKSRLNMYDLI